MTVTQWVVLGYGLVSLFAARGVYSYMRSDFMGTSGDWDIGDTVMVGYLALLVGWFWPLILPVAVVAWKPRKSPAERAAEKRKQEEYIRKLEKELGIHDR